MRQKLNPLSQNWILRTSFVRLQEFYIVMLLTAIILKYNKMSWPSLLPPGQVADQIPDWVHNIIGN